MQGVGAALRWVCPDPHSYVHTHTRARAYTHLKESLEERMEKTARLWDSFKPRQNTVPGHHSRRPLPGQGGELGLSHKVDFLGGRMTLCGPLIRQGSEVASCAHCHCRQKVPGGGRAGRVGKPAAHTWGPCGRLMKWSLLDLQTSHDPRLMVRTSPSMSLQERQQGAEGQERPGCGSQISIYHCFLK